MFDYFIFFRYMESYGSSSRNHPQKLVPYLTPKPWIFHVSYRSWPCTALWTSLPSTGKPRPQCFFCFRDSPSLLRLRTAFKRQARPDALRHQGRASRAGRRPRCDPQRSRSGRNQVRIGVPPIRIHPASEVPYDSFQRSTLHLVKLPRNVGILWDIIYGYWSILRI